MAAIVVMSALASISVLLHLHEPGKATLLETVARLQAKVEVQTRTIQQLRRHSRILQTYPGRADDAESDAGGSLLNNFDLPSRASPGVGIFVMVEKSYEVAYFRQLVALRCYAHNHGYALRVLGPTATCVQKNIFFHKHCRVAEALGAQPEGFTAFVMDADVIPVLMHRNLSFWMRGGEDLVFYEREWSPELAAGNYLVRNTPFSQHFLREWVAYEDKVPKSGFHSDDNGAIHVVLNDVLGVPCADYVRQLYYNLTNEGMDNLCVPLPYKHFCAAAQLARGPPRRWVGIKFANTVGNITILPRMHAWVMDGDASFGKGSLNTGSVFHHRVKTAGDMARYFQPLGGVEDCAVMESSLVDGEVYGANVDRYIQVIAEQYGSWDVPAGHPVPFFMSITHCCARTLRCRPLEPGEPLRVGDFNFPEPWAFLNLSGSLGRACGAEPGAIRAPEALPPCSGAEAEAYMHMGPIR